MTDIRKIDFTCPECGHDELLAERHEIIFHPLFDDIDIDKELAMSGDIAINDSEILEESVITSVICGDCGYEIVPKNWQENYEDPVEPLINWLEEHNMLPKKQESTGE